MEHFLVVVQLINRTTMTVISCTTIRKCLSVLQNPGSGLQFLQHSDNGIFRLCIHQSCNYFFVRFRRDDEAEVEEMKLIPQGGEHDNVGYAVGYEQGPANRAPQNEQEAAILEEQLKAEKRKEDWEEMQAQSSKDIEERFKIKRGVNAPLSQQKAMIKARLINRKEAGASGRKVDLSAKTLV